MGTKSFLEFLFVQLRQGELKLISIDTKDQKKSCCCFEIKSIVIGSYDVDVFKTASLGHQERSVLLSLFAADNQF